MFEILEHYFRNLIEYTVLGVEFIGYIIILTNIIKTVVGLIKKTPETVRMFGNSMSHALSILMIGELLKSILVQNLQELLILAGVMAIRAGMIFLLHWEKNHEE